LHAFVASRHLFTLTPLDHLKLPPYKGSTLRGGFGHAFKRVVCTFRDRPCDGCLLKHRCVYAYVFETPPPENTTKMTKYLRAPHPFVIEPPMEEKELFRPGEPLTFGLVLVGRALDYLPYFVYAFEELGKMGIGRGKGKYRLEAVTLNGETVYDGASGVLKSREPGPYPVGVSVDLDRANEEITDNGQQTRITFLTPTRLVHEGNLDPDPAFQTIFRTLLRRLSMLSYFHCGQELEVDYRGLIERAGEVGIVAKRTRWHDWERYSARQDERMKLGGFVGEMTFSGVPPEFLPFLEVGELVHVGKGTGFGLGRYEVGQASALGRWT
jgi:hypothetical protein